MASKELLAEIEVFAFKYAPRDHVHEFVTELRLIIERSIKEATDYMLTGKPV